MPVYIDGYEIDAALSEEHNLDSEVTEYEVETGSDKGDGIRPLPDEVTIEGIVSDSPFGALAARRAAASLDPTGTMAPSNEALEHLKAVRARREAVVIETSLGIYRDMALKTLSVPRSAQEGRALRFRATFKKVEIVTNERATVRVATPSAAKKASLGHKASTPTPVALPPPTKAQRQVLEVWAAGGESTSAARLAGVL